MESATKATSTEATDNGAAASAGSDSKLEILNPATGALIRELPVDGPEQVAEAAARVRSAQPIWETLGFAGRARWLAAFRDWLLANEREITDTLQAETGKVRAEAALEVPYLAGSINFYVAKGPHFLADEEPSAFHPMWKTKRLRIAYRPFSLVGIISPWNFPLMLSLGDAIPALVAGCAVVIKPSEFTPLALMQIVEGWKQEVGGPDVIDVVNGIGETGTALVDEADFVQFTGSEATGKKVMARAAETLTPVSLELGGKDPMIVLADADIERAANAAAFGGMMNSGQICMSIERVYVEEPVYDDFLARLTAEVSKLKQGADEGRSYGSEVGAMTSPNQTAIVERHVDEARESGARVLTGGRRRPGQGDYYEPTVIADVDHSMTVMREETFGPVLGVMKVRDADEAVKLANDTTFGLSASVFAGDRERGEAIARRLEVGACNVNDVLTNYVVHDVPMGGWKNSGIGSRHGSYGIRKYCHTESIVSPRTPLGKRDPLWFPYTPGKQRVVQALNRFFSGRGLRQRLGLGRRR